MHYYDTKNDIIISDFSNSLYSEEISQIKKGLIAVAEKYGIVDKKNTMFFANVDLEYEVGTTFGTFKESAGKQSDDIVDLVRMLPMFKEVFNDAVIIEVHKNRYYNDENTVSFVELLGGYVHNGYFVPVRFGVKTFSKDSPKLYVVVSQNKIEVERLGLSSQTESEPHGPASTSTISISKIIRNVNPKDTKLLRYLPSTMLNNKQKQGKRKGVIDSKTYTDDKNDNAYEKHYEREKEGIYKETKRMLRAKARAEGYIEGEDGYLYKDDSKKTKEVTFDDDGNLIPITKRYDESNSDVRYQHLSSEAEEQAKADELEALREENKALKAMDKRRWQMIDYLQKQLDQWKRGGKKLDYRGIENLARSLIKEYGAKVDVKAYAKELTGFFNYMTNNSNPSADVIKKTMTDIANEIRAENNAAVFIASKLKEYGWDISHVKKHQDFSGKYCPHRTLDLGWQRFLDMIKNELDKEKEMTRAEVQAMIDASKERVYHWWKEIPKWAYDPLMALYKKGYFVGEAPDDLNLPYSTMRTLVILARALKEDGKITY